ncbi:hypothetical protein SISNIDRAFT_471575 [Sistotremastrum niveocremeum HHB9708]|uniref:Uncharacterized protein n=1 Tax=Sistotremastrum niveocremeum HHB9708 TaxID=1314777 RepID=A0A164MGP3_9AGAM|nr:hypothetical protein SISNIDRAFT_471575 [Sistotremastrum niveocremeum HHB9708]
MDIREVKPSLCWKNGHESAVVVEVMMESVEAELGFAEQDARMTSHRCVFAGPNRGRVDNITLRETQVSKFFEFIKSRYISYVMVVIGRYHRDIKGYPRASQEVSRVPRSGWYHFGLSRDARFDIVGGFGSDISGPSGGIGGVVGLSDLLRSCYGTATRSLQLHAQVVKTL